MARDCVKMSRKLSDFVRWYPGHRTKTCSKRNRRYRTRAGGNPRDYVVHLAERKCGGAGSLRFVRVTTIAHTVSHMFRAHASVWIERENVSPRALLERNDTSDPIDRTFGQEPLRHRFRVRVAIIIPWMPSSLEIIDDGQGTFDALAP